MQRARMSRFLVAIENADVPRCVCPHLWRGQPNGIADIVVIDPETVGSEDAALHFDLPGGAPRLTAGGIGVKRVLVNGVETIRDGKATDARPGKVLRSGRDTVTVATS